MVFLDRAGALEDEREQHAQLALVQAPQVLHQQRLQERRKTAQRAVGVGIGASRRSGFGRALRLDAAAALRVLGAAFSRGDVRQHAQCAVHFAGRGRTAVRHQRRDRLLALGRRGELVVQRGVQRARKGLGQRGNEKRGSVGIVYVYARQSGG